MRVWFIGFLFFSKTKPFYNLDEVNAPPVQKSPACEFYPYILHTLR